MIHVLTPEEGLLWGTLEEAIRKLGKGFNLIELAEPFNTEQQDIIGNIQNGFLPSDSEIAWFLKKIEEYIQAKNEGLVP